MSDGDFGADYEEEVALRDGTRVFLRMIGPEDADLLRSGFAAMSPRSRHQRFLMYKRSLSDAELQVLTSIDGFDHVAIGAGIVEDGRVIEPLGVARFVRVEPGSAIAEAAVAVVDAWQKRGLGGLLWRRLVAAARERDITHFRVEMLAENFGMRRLAALLGPRDRLHAGDGVLTAEFQLPESTTEAEQSGAYRALRLAARAAGADDD